MIEPDRGHDFGADWVDVSIEPWHVEQFQTQGVRVYEVTIPPGGRTTFHRHTRDTTYVVIAGGRVRSQELRPRRAGLVHRWGMVAAGLGRRWERLPTGVVVLRAHRRRPLIHQVTAHPANTGDVRLIGVELPSEHRCSAVLSESATVRREHPGAPWPVYRVRVDPGGETGVALPAGGVLVVVDGTASLTLPSHLVTSGQARWLGSGTVSIRAHPGRDLDAVVVPA
ncbi:hypothetical protein [Mycobacterium sp.]|uniref:hypothetical protein n=1 Tax=Mycobacterium sp. TaxID=1785 RepID=UPI001275C968|nr:hypothetical protein [Mycobacterium sp.]KAA8946943.1 MAG: hypothetical protein F6Q13_17905 [Mycobacterium sp.]